MKQSYRKRKKKIKIEVAEIMNGIFYRTISKKVELLKALEFPI